MDLAAVKILFLSQGECSLKRHTQDFLDLYHLVHYDDSQYMFFECGDKRVPAQRWSLRDLYGIFRLGAITQWIPLYHLRDRGGVQHASHAHSTSCIHSHHPSECETRAHHKSLTRCVSQLHHSCGSAGGIRGDVPSAKADVNSNSSNSRH